MLSTNIHLPLSDAESLLTEGPFLLVIPLSDSISTDANLDTMVVARIYDDEVYYSDASLEPGDEIGLAYLDIRYIREARLRDVVDGEWEMCYGPACPHEYMEANPGANMGTPVKVVCLQPLDYDLRTLSKTVRLGRAGIER